MERSRASGALSVQGAITQWHLYNGCSPTSFTQTASSDGPFTGMTRLMLDRVVPNFRERSAKGEVFFNPMYSETRVVTSSGGNGPHIKSKSLACPSPPAYHEYRRDGDWFGRMISNSSSGPAVQAGLVNQSVLSSLRIEVATSCRNRQGRGGPNNFETLAEMGKSIRMLRGIGTSALQAVTSAKGAANGYLLYRYGLRPLISSAGSVLTGLQKHTGKTRETVRANGSLHGDQTTFSSVVQDSGYTESTYQVYTTETVSLRAMILEEYVRDMATNLGLSAKGLITLPYELVSYSFVADWFANVGDFLGALSPAFGYNVLGNCMTEVTEKTSIWTCTGTKEKSGTYSILRPMTGVVTDSRVIKHRYGLPGAGLVIRNNFGFGDLTRAADAFALVAQKLLR